MSFNAEIPEETMKHAILPPELERYIFEMSTLSSWRSIPSYLLVARRVHIWIEPLLYNVVVLKCPTIIQGQQEIRLTPFPARSKEFLSQNVQHLVISGHLPQPELAPLLSACVGITDLALWTPGPVSRTCLPLLQALPRLTRLSADLAHLFGGPLRMSFAHPAIAALTHLELLAPGFDDWRLYAGLARMPHLTHLAFRDRFHPLVIRGALAHCANLKVLGVIWGARKGLGDLRLVEEDVVDPRLFMVMSVDPVRGWVACARGGADDMWARAEAFVAKKQAGEIKLSRLWLK
ncbi:hypothetical protein C8J57DRAFT_724976 [Mycena rebaudengoi]|nr:hypothetical protein C8J57DRAFT_724976 [Mycena rebaudengoi]